MESKDRHAELPTSTTQVVASSMIYGRSRRLTDDHLAILCGIPLLVLLLGAFGHNVRRVLQRVQPREHAALRRSPMPNVAVRLTCGSVRISILPEQRWHLNRNAQIGVE
jgi:hypothetical protein